MKLEVSLATNDMLLDTIVQGRQARPRRPALNDLEAWHGHVRPLKGKGKARCGGPKRCDVCIEEETLLAERQNPTSTTATDDPHGHKQALKKTGFWGKEAAGCLVAAVSTGRLLFNHRSRVILQPNTYGGWGGAMDSNETPEEAVRRELVEEAEYHGKLALYKMVEFADPKSGFKYHNYLAIVPDEFVPVLNRESQGYEWCDFGDWPQPLHPGIVYLLKHSARDMKRLIDAVRRRH